MSQLVEVAQVLAAPVSGLLGVWVGGVIQGKREDKRLEHERQRNTEQLRAEADDAHDNRLFEHRRSAYAHMIETYLHQYHEIFNFHFHGADLENPESMYREIWGASVGVSLYGSAAANRLAGDLAEGLAQFMAAGGGDEAEWLNRAVGETYGEFIAEVRRDLGSTARPAWHRQVGDAPNGRVALDLN